jgi:hypothetical protein
MWGQSMVFRIRFSLSEASKNGTNSTILQVKDPFDSSTFDDFSIVKREVDQVAPLLSKEGQAIFAEF